MTVQDTNDNSSTSDSNKSDKTDCSNYRGISLLSTSYKTLTKSLLSKLIPYADEIIWDHQCGFRHNRSTTDQILYIRQILEKKWEYNGTVHQLYTCLKKDYDSVRMQSLYNILIEFYVPRKLVKFVRMIWSEAIHFLVDISPMTPVYTQTTIRLHRVEETSANSRLKSQ
jgi:hypothetical protein